MAENVLIRPTLSGITYEAKGYGPMGNGFTDRLFLLGHADTLPLNDPYQVADLNQVVLDLKNDLSSPLYRSLLEAYHSGARDIWIVPVAPMSEYQPNIALRDTAYYATYQRRLQVAYDLLTQWDLVQMICPIEAPFYDALGVDFLTQLVDHCAQAFSITGCVRLGFIGTRMTHNMTQADINAMVNDPRLSMFQDDGKFTAIVVGEGIFNFLELPIFYPGSVHIATAAQYAAMPQYKSLTHTVLSQVISYANGYLTDGQIAELCNTKLNPLWKSTKGERNVPYQTLLMSDNTLAQTGSDFWSLTQMRLVGMVINDIRNLGNMYLGTVSFGTFQQKVNNYFLVLFGKNYLRSYSASVVRDPSDKFGAIVNITITPYFGVRQIAFSVVAGPS